MLILLMVLYFSVVGGLFYKLFISAPSEQQLVKEPVVEPVQGLTKELAHESVTSKLISNGAADVNVG